MQLLPQHDTLDIKPAAPAIAWLETLAVTLAMPLLGLWLWPEDPLFIYTHFPWLVMAPLLAGLRYGFAYGFTSALLLILAIAVSWRWQWLPIVHFPKEYSLGLLLTGMLAGEFCDMWMRRTRRLAASNEYRRMRMDEFTRAYHLLKVSHDRLEHRLAANTQSLREALHSMRRQLLATSATDNTSLLEQGDLILGILANYGQIQVASLYEVNSHAELEHPPIARLGTGRPLDAADPLITEALRSGQMACVDAGAKTPHEDDRTVLLAAIPIIDVTGRIWAIAAVHEMPFVAFQEDNLKFLAVMGGHIGDILANAIPGASGADGAAGEFSQHLRRSLEDARRYRLPAILVGLSFDIKHAPPDLIELIMARRRGLDQLWQTKRSNGTPLIFLLMPLTDGLGLEGYLARMERMLRERYGLPLELAGVTVQSRELTGKDTLDGVMAYIGRIRDGQ
ncbi:MAG: PelD GGDEF domain-containing protein [Pseudomonadota bacterium]